MRVRLLIPLLCILVILLLVSACSTDDEDAPAETGAQATSTPADDRAGEQATAMLPTRTPAQPSPTTSPSVGDDEESQAAAEPTDTPSNTPSTDGDAADTDIDSESPDEPTATSESANDPPPAEPENPAPELGSIDEWHNGDPVALSDLRGSTVLLVFWADY